MYTKRYDPNSASKTDRALSALFQGDVFDKGLKTNAEIEAERIEAEKEARERAEEIERRMKEYADMAKAAEDAEKEAQSALEALEDGNYEGENEEVERAALKAKADDARKAADKAKAEADEFLKSITEVPETEPQGKPEPQAETPTPPETTIIRQETEESVAEDEGFAKVADTQRAIFDGRVFNEIENY